MSNAALINATAPAMANLTATATPTVNATAVPAGMGGTNITAVHPLHPAQPFQSPAGPSFLGDLGVHAPRQMIKFVHKPGVVVKSPEQLREKLELTACDPKRPEDIGVVLVNADPFHDALRQQSAKVGRTELLIGCAAQLSGGMTAYKVDPAFRKLGRSRYANYVRNRQHHMRPHLFHDSYSSLDHEQDDESDEGDFVDNVDGEREAFLLKRALTAIPNKDGEYGRCLLEEDAGKPGCPAERLKYNQMWAKNNQHPILLPKVQAKEGLGVSRDIQKTVFIEREKTANGALGGMKVTEFIHEDDHDQSPEKAAYIRRWASGNPRPIAFEPLDEPLFHGRDFDEHDDEENGLQKRGLFNHSCNSASDKRKPRCQGKVAAAAATAAQQPLQKRGLFSHSCTSASDQMKPRCQGKVAAAAAATTPQQPLQKRSPHGDNNIHVYPPRHTEPGLEKRSNGTSNGGGRRGRNWKRGLETSQADGLQKRSTGDHHVHVHLPGEPAAAPPAAKRDLEKRSNGSSRGGGRRGRKWKRDLEERSNGTTNGGGRRGRKWKRELEASQTDGLQKRSPDTHIHVHPSGAAAAAAPAAKRDLEKRSNGTTNGGGGRRPRKRDLEERSNGTTNGGGARRRPQKRDLEERSNGTSGNGGRRGRNWKRDLEERSSGSSRGGRWGRNWKRDPDSHSNGTSRGGRPDIVQTGNGGNRKPQTLTLTMHKRDLDAHSNGTSHGDRQGGVQRQTGPPAVPLTMQKRRLVRRGFSWSPQESAAVKREVEPESKLQKRNFLKVLGKGAQMAMKFLRKREADGSADYDLMLKRHLQESGHDQVLLKRTFDGDEQMDRRSSHGGRGKGGRGWGRKGSWSRRDVDDDDAMTVRSLLSAHGDIFPRGIQDLPKSTA